VYLHDSLWQLRRKYILANRVVGCAKCGRFASQESINTHVVPNRRWKVGGRSMKYLYTLIALLAEADKRKLARDTMMLVPKCTLQSRRVGIFNSSFLISLQLFNDTLQSMYSKPLQHKSFQTPRSCELQMLCLRGAQSSLHSETPKLAFVCVSGRLVVFNVRSGIWRGLCRCQIFSRHLGYVS
jgi:hypothetical protein